MTIGTEYARATIEALPADQRHQRLSALAGLLSQRLAPFSEWESYWREVAATIEELRALGHDLWRHDFDGEARELWGWDYKRKEGSGLLQLQFHFGGEVRTFWRTENPRLGVDDDPDETD